MEKEVDVIGLLMLLIAIILDSIGLILFVLSFAGIGVPISFILDIIGFLTIGIWSILHSGFKTALRLGGSTISELIPFWGDVCPSWTIHVLLEIL